MWVGKRVSFPIHTYNGLLLQTNCNLTLDNIENATSEPIFIATSPTVLYIDKNWFGQELGMNMGERSFARVRWLRTSWRMVAVWAGSF